MWVVDRGGKRFLNGGGRDEAPLHGHMSRCSGLNNLLAVYKKVNPQGDEGKNRSCPSLPGACVVEEVESRTREGLLDARTCVQHTVRALSCFVRAHTHVQRALRARSWVHNT